VSRNEPTLPDFDAHRRDHDAFDAIERYLPVASTVVFRGLTQRGVLLQGLHWTARHERDLKIVGLTWWSEDAWDPRPGRQGEYIFRHTLSIHYTSGAPSEETNWGRGPRPSRRRWRWRWRHA